jgi:endonuclease V-like protein UPF0215 family
MDTVLAIVLVASWVVILLGLFLYERLDRRIAALNVQVEQLLRLQRTLMTHVNADTADTEVIPQLRNLLSEGKTYEAIVSYRAYAGVSYKEAKAFIDALRTGAQVPGQLRSSSLFSNASDLQNV